MRGKMVIAMKRHLREENQKLPPDGSFVDVPQDKWPQRLIPQGLVGVKRSHRFLAQIYREGNMTRLTVNRTAIDFFGAYQDGITWDELQEVKSRCGFGNRDAVEVYPPDDQVVKAANMRHLWIFPEGYVLHFVWRTPDGSGLKLGCVAEEILGKGGSEG